MAYAAEILEEGLWCEICHETFRRPKSLPCGHTFCEECLTELAGSLRDLCCPLCRRDVSLPVDGVAGLPTDYRLAKMSEKFSEVTADQGQCVTQRCDYHPYEHLKYFCKTKACGVPICGQCIEDSHGGHSIVVVKQAVEKRMKKVNSLLKETKGQIDKHRERLLEIQQLKDKIKDAKRQSKETILESYAERVRLLVEDKDKLLSDVKQSYQDVLKDLNAEKTAVQQQMTRLEEVVKDVEQTKTKDAVKFLRRDLEPNGLRDKLKETKVDLPFPPLEYRATLSFSPQKIKKEQLVNGELVPEVFTSGRQTLATRLSDTVRQRFRGVRDTWDRAPWRSISVPNLRP
ncbi:tripartite motif-containing 13-like [Branchiostoma floridae]|uniref:Tripartite motif-containing 13-like n=1 Tax=Branchiostoma floridae TaxID=7739 RepID=A0A9J7MU30_BRAFL|nr:tripartite motif-containing 13-like [Branchiostoma floridae]